MPKAKCLMLQTMLKTPSLMQQPIPKIKSLVQQICKLTI